MASILSAGTTSGTALNMSGDTSGVLQLATNGTTTALTLDASQNATFAGTLTTTGITNSGVATGARFNPTGSSVTGNGMYLPAANSLGLSTNGTNAVYIDSSQNVGIGISPNTKFEVNGQIRSSGTTAQALYLYGAASTTPYITINQYGVRSWDIGAGYYSSGTFSIQSGQVNGVYLGATATSWASASDERLKDIIEPIDNALTKVNGLRSVIGKYKTDEEGVRRSFLIAQDIQTQFPEALESSDPDKLGVQYTDVIPLLVASIKELKAINDTQAETINALTARIVALEGA